MLIPGLSPVTVSNFYINPSRSVVVNLSDRATIRGGDICSLWYRNVNTFMICGSDAARRASVAKAGSDLSTNRIHHLSCGVVARINAFYTILIQRLQLRIVDSCIKQIAKSPILRLLVPQAKSLLKRLCRI